MISPEKSNVLPAAGVPSLLQSWSFDTDTGVFRSAPTSVTVRVSTEPGRSPPGFCPASGIWQANLSSSAAVAMFFTTKTESRSLLTRYWPLLVELIHLESDTVTVYSILLPGFFHASAAER